MEYAPLLIVQDLFQLSGIGLTLVPDFPVPEGRWSNLQEQVLIEVSNGDRFETTAQLSLTHFNFGGRHVDAERRWRVLVTLPLLDKAAVPVGSRILIRPEVCEMLARHEG